MADMFNKYPALTMNTRIRRKYGSRYTLENGNEKKELKVSGFEVLKYCEGDLSVSEIFNLLAEQWEITLEEVADFLRKLEEKHFIEMGQMPLSRKIEIDEDLGYAYPVHASFQITDRCNLQCIYCYGKFNPRNQRHFDITKVEPLFKRLSSRGMNSIELTGGEPLIHPHFKELLALAVKYFNTVGLISNGVLFDDDLFERLGRKEYRKKMVIQISIDGFSEEVNGIMRGAKNTFHKSVDTIKKLVELDLLHRIALVLTYENVHELEQTVDYFKSIGGKSFGISLADPIGKGVDIVHRDGTSLANTHSPEGIEFYKTLAKVSVKHKDYLVNSEKSPGEASDFTKKHNCGAGWRAININQSGDICFCNMLGTNGPKIGNVLRDDLDSLFVVDNPMIDFFQRFEKCVDEPECVDCYYKTMCNSCLTKIYLSNLDRLRKDKGLCPIVVRSGMDKIFDFDSDIDVNI